MASVITSIVIGSPDSSSFLEPLLLPPAPGACAGWDRLAL